MAFRKSITALKKERKREWSRRAVAAKARKRMEQAESMEAVGGIITWGCLGTHSIRLLAYPGDEFAMAVVVDGEHRRPRTYRGVLRCMAKMVDRRMKA